MTALPPLNALRAFEASARHLNFRLAAEELGVTQGAVAQQVRGLEARLGAGLFERLPRGLRLTEAGRRFHAPLRRAFRLIEEAVDDLSGQRQITISVTPSFASKWLVPRLNGFMSSYPDVSVQVDAGERLANFQSDGIDIAVRQSRAPIAPDLIATPLFSTEFVVVCSPELAAEITVPADLMKHVLLSDSHGLWPLFLERAGVEGRPRMMSFSQTSLAIDAAISGQGFALANAPLVSSELAAGRLVQPLSEVLIDDLSFFIVTPKKPRQPELVKQMRDWLLSQV
ncbi:LysR family transcriptional regulator, glycine cleavage system transcriptional activator [Ruegeria halocynthiae]|uniref:LysR family transcriptional regulator, glycine cleavage system transcriptional activator n=1 Tax=Ruegeria halocynthiae TaxID=985054 RepID=A0A1H3CKA1_9RHOB|nr:LysR substrate-binding domain-containing protein [Ruegeria halocynthiae]SDX54583.1 LysR family transcriptional regulator, glycine cleavage system transcriptional activator [Ruegeria halocynthiae]